MEKAGINLLFARIIVIFAHMIKPIVLTPQRDPMGKAILDYQKSGKTETLRVFSSMFEEDEMPIEHLFREYEQMPALEKTALLHAKGKILDVGAGAGCHSLALQEKGFDVKSIDISPLSCEAMKLRGLRDVECINIFDPHLETTFDTILLLMNGTGIAGKIDNLPQLFNRLKALLSDDGQILIDSSDLKYIYENEDGSFDIDLNGNYYGEVDYQMIYKDVEGEPFDWLYVDFPLLKATAESCGLNADLVAEGEHYDYLAKLTKVKTPSYPPA